MSYVPRLYEEFKQRFPDVTELYEALAGSCHEWGPLDSRTRRLVKLGIAMGLSSEGGIKSHARRALNEGISLDELRHASLLTLTTAGYPAMIAAMKWIDEVGQARQ